MRFYQPKWAKLLLSILLVFTLLPWGEAKDRTANAAMIHNVFAFGSGADGRLGHGEIADPNANKLNPTAIVIPGETVTEISAGFSHTLVLTEDGKVYSFGDGTDGKLGHGDANDRLVPTQIDELEGIKVIAIEAGTNHSLVLTDNSEVYSFGAGSLGQLGHGNTAQQSTPVKIANHSNIMAIAAGNFHSLLLNTDGEVFSFGHGALGRLGHGNTDPQNIPTHITPLPPVQAIAAEAEFSLALTKDGKVYSFGRGAFGQLGHGNRDNQLSPTLIDGLNSETVTAISAGNSHSLVLTKDSRKVYSFGNGFAGMLGHGDTLDQLSPKEITALSDMAVLEIAAGGSHSVVRAWNGDIYTFGYGFDGQLGLGDQHNKNVPTKIDGLFLGERISAGNNHTLVIAAEDDSLTYSVGVSVADPIVFYPKLVGYTTSLAQTVTLSKTGTGTITGLSVALTGANKDLFEFIGAKPAPVLRDSAPSTAFYVRPKIGLPAGIYSASVSITADRGVSQSLNMSFEVTATPTYSVSVTQTGTFVFDEKTEGYGALSSKSFTVARTGTGDITNLSVSLAQGSQSQFTLGTNNGNNVLNDSVKSIGFTVVPKPGLTLETYTDTVLITGDHGINESFNVSFTVNAAPKITTQPADTTVDEGSDATFAVVASGTGLTYQWQVNTGSGFSNLTDETNATLTVADVTAGMNGNQYRVVVSGTIAPPVDSANATLSVNPIPSAPVINSVAGDTEVELNWAQVTYATHYAIYAREASGSYGTAVATVGSDVLSYDVTSLTNGTTYYFVVKALNGALESVASNEVSAIPQVPAPGAPIISAEPGNAQVTVNWGLVAGATEYTIFQMIDVAGPEIEEETVSGTESSYVVTGLTNGATYYFVVKASNPGGDSGASNTASSIPRTVPAAPTDVAAAVGNGSATITFTAPADNGGSAITGFTIFQMAELGGSETQVGTVGGTESTYMVTGLTNGTTYYFVVKANNAAGASAASNTAIATPLSVPGAPTAVAAVAGNGQATITFTAPVDNGGSAITGYEVTSSVGNVVVTGDESPITVAGLNNGTSYTFTVKAINSVGKSDASTASNAVMPSAPVYTQPDPNPPVSTTSVEVLVNGKVESAGTATTKTVNNQLVTTVVVDQKKLEDKLVSQPNGSVVTIPVINNSDVVIGELNGQMIKLMEDKKAVLVIQTGRATYTLPAGLINIGALSELIGNSAELKDIKVQLEIAAPTADTVKVVENAAKKGTFTIVAPPVNFTVKGMDGNKTIDVSKFNAYVERIIAIPDGVDPNKITTGLVVDQYGKTRHVPTKIVVRDGKYYAVINSLTNSTYAVVWHPLQFKDVADHWAAESINNMGSRMVIDGTGHELFSPDQEITRAEFAAIVVRGLGLKLESGASTFSDVKSEDWFASVINTATAYGLLDGFEDGTVRPNDIITREQAMVIISKAMAITNLKAKLTAQSAEEALASYADAAEASVWATQSIADCVLAGVVSGKQDMKLAPKDFITRAEAAAIIERLLQKSDLI